MSDHPSSVQVHARMPDVRDVPAGFVFGPAQERLEALAARVDHLLAPWSGSKLATTIDWVGARVLIEWVGAVPIEALRIIARQGSSEHRVEVVRASAQLQVHRQQAAIFRAMAEFESRGFEVVSGCAGERRTTIEIVIEDLPGVDKREGERVADHLQHVLDLQVVISWEIDPPRAEPV